MATAKEKLAEKDKKQPAMPNNHVNGKGMGKDKKYLESKKKK